MRSAGHKVTLLLYEGDVSSVRHNMPRRDLLLLLASLSAGAWTSQTSDTAHTKDWILGRIQSVNQKEIQKINTKNAVQDAFSKLRSRKSFTTDDLQLMSVMEAKELLDRHFVFVHHACYVLD